MDIAKADLVEATAGREQGKVFLVIDVQDEFLLLADGKYRKLEAPKRKKCKHVHPLPGDCGRVAEKIRRNEKITNSELRKAIAAYRDSGNPDQEG